MEVSKVLEMSHFKGLIIGKRRLDKILDDIKKKKKSVPLGMTAEWLICSGTPECPSKLWNFILL